MKSEKQNGLPVAIDGQRRYNTPTTSKREVYAMTLCVAALCENREAIVCVADRLLTAKYPDGTIMRMEGQTKIYEPTSYFSILCSGNASVFPPLNDVVIEKMKEAYKTHIPSMQATSQIVVDTFADIEKNLKISVEETSIILAGFDNSGGHIYVVSKSDANPEDHAGFTAVGCGRYISDQKIIEFGHDKTSLVLPTMLKLFVAKKEAEADPEVGTKTDVLVNIRGEQHVIRYGDETEIIEILDEYYVKYKMNPSNDICNKYQQAIKPRLEYLFGIAKG